MSRLAHAAARCPRSPPRPPALRRSAGCATPPARPTLPPIVFVHGNGDTAALWTTTIWRFEIERLAARSPARDRPALPARRATTTTRSSRPQLDRRAHGRSRRRGEARCSRRPARRKVVLVGNSRGGYAIRNFIANGGGAARCRTPSSAACRTTASGPTRAFLPGSEFNGAGPFLTALNAPQGAEGNEVDARRRAG